MRVGAMSGRAEAIVMGGSWSGGRRRSPSSVQYSTLNRDLPGGTFPTHSHTLSTFNCLDKSVRNAEIIWSKVWLVQVGFFLTSLR